MCPGAQINLIIRGSIGLTPEILSRHPTIRITFIIGRFLEHSRVYKFGIGDQEKIYIGSADLMHRNLRPPSGGLTPVYDLNSCLDHK